MRCVAPYARAVIVNTRTAAPPVVALHGARQLMAPPLLLRTKVNLLLRGSAQDAVVAVTFLRPPFLRRSGR